MVIAISVEIHEYTVEGMAGFSFALLSNAV
jgi:hypothetical protein